MEKYSIFGGKILSGEVIISGSKNSSLAILPACLLIKGKVTLRNVPNLKDVRFMLQVIESLGGEFTFEDNTVEIDTSSLKSFIASYEIVKQMRASIYVLAPLLHRFGEARVSLPGGCAIGNRPINLHIKGLKDLGVEFQLEHGYIEGSVDKMKGQEIYLDFPSVGATCQLILAGVLAEGKTIILNAAKEPEIEDLCNFLNKAGAQIEGLGTNSINITGVVSLSGCEHSIIPDRIETGSFTLLGAAVCEDLVIKNIIPTHIEAVIDKIKETGVSITQEKNTIRIKRTARPKNIDIKTLPYPAFPTDLQAPFMSFLSTSDGFSIIHETIFENRFHHVAELNRLGADIKTEGQTAYIKGVKQLFGAQIMASDLRAGFSLVLAGLMADDETIINRIYHIDRGYENLENKIKKLGGDIKRIK
ncbi:UDP-N-acetylglucosamine 1-carboxyvinyltransferase [Candidatus Dependentiae bacterium]|nr:UDP-N-acetylglucosamine 1-carboxyvinyltransferase [Candidatus Dependentiae bacterium]